MKKILLLVLGLQLISTTGQNTEEPNSNWTKKGSITFLLNQSAFDNWTAGGITNMSGTFSVNYDFNYNKDDWAFMKLEFLLGPTTNLIS
jgi:hypothetical protein